MSTLKVNTIQEADGTAFPFINYAATNYGNLSNDSDGTTSTSYVDTGISQAITPSSGSKILVMVEGGAFGYKPSTNEVSFYINLVATPSGGSATQLREIQVRFTSAGTNGTRRLFDSWTINNMHTHGLDGSTAITYKVQHKLDQADRIWAAYRGASIVLLELKG